MKLWALVPELVLAGLCLGLVPVAGFARGRWTVAPPVIAVIGLLAAMAACGWMLRWEPVLAFHGAYVIDGLANVLKMLMLAGALISVLLLSAYFRGHLQLAHAPIAVLFSTLGAVGLVSSLDLGLIVLFLQLMSMAGYVLVVMVRSDPLALEAAIKYFIYGAVALAVMAYGLTFVYGLTGSLDLRVVGSQLGTADRLWLAVALGLIVVGYGFEMTMVPFHVWSPDVFSGSTAPVAGYLSVVPKIAGFGGLLRFVLHGLPEGLLQWPLWVAIAAAVTMTFGNLVALRQQRLKRLLAYSSIAQAGYMLMAAAVADQIPAALPAIGFYLGAYLLMNLGAFAVVGHLERTLGTDELTAYRGLGYLAPLPALTLTLSLLSLAGIPPLAGFAGKVLLLAATVDGGFTWLAVIAVINMTVGLYYYVRVIAAAYLWRSEVTYELSRDSSLGAAYGLTVAGTLLFGVLPALLLEWMRLANQLPPLQ